MNCQREHNRTQVLKKYGASEFAVDQLLGYCNRKFEIPGASEQSSCDLPLADEPFIESWQHYIDEAENSSVVAALLAPLVQWNFPIRKGLSENREYNDVTRRFGSVENCALAIGPQLVDPAGLTLQLQKTLAGQIPILAFSARADFEYAWRALTQRNEPTPIPGGMGAAMIAGYNNITRINVARQRFLESNKAQLWPQALRELLQKKERYQDKFILISPGEYSAVPASSLALQEGRWRELSVQIRIHHEVTHYVTQRLCGSMQNHLLDELIADFMGMSTANGAFRGDWFLRCMGVDEDGNYRKGSRMQHYTADIAPNSEAFDILVRLISAAAQNMEHMSAVLKQRAMNAEPRVVLALAQFTLDELADEKSVARVVERLDQLILNREKTDDG